MHESGDSYDVIIVGSGIAAAIPSSPGPAAICRKI